MAAAAGWGSVACRMWLQTAVRVGASPQGSWMRAAEPSVTEQDWPAGRRGGSEAWGKCLSGTFCVLHPQHENNQAEKGF